MWEKPKPALVVGLIAALITIPAAVGMAQLEGDFRAEDFLDESLILLEGSKLLLIASLMRGSLPIY